MSIVTVACLALAVVFISGVRLILGAIHHEARKIMNDLTEIKQKVTETLGAERSAVVLLGSLKSALDAAIASNSTDNGAALKDLSDSLGAGAADLAAAVVANTPAVAAPVTSGATANTAPTAPADLPDGHPLKPVDEPTPVA